MKPPGRHVTETLPSPSSYSTTALSSEPLLYVVLKAAWAGSGSRSRILERGGSGTTVRGGRRGFKIFKKRPEPEKTPYFRVVGALLFLSFNPWAERITLYTSHRGRRRETVAATIASPRSRAPLLSRSRMSYVFTRTFTRARERTRVRTYGGVNVTYETACLDKCVECPLRSPIRRLSRGDPHWTLFLLERF